MTNFFFERYRPEICRGLHKWCCERILTCFSSFRAKKKFSKVASFFTFLHIRGHRFLEKWLTTFLRDTGLKFVVDCTNGVANEFKAFKVVSSEKKFFSKIGNFLTFFAYPGSQISWKMTNFFFERYRPEIYRGLHKWCCEQILRCFGSFRAKKIFSKVASFFTVFAYPGSQISWKMTNYFFERYRPEIYGLHKWCCERILRRFRLFRAKQFFLKIGNFLTLFAYPGSQISWKMTNFFFERYRPEICRGLHKWCCERILRCFRSFRAKKNFSKVASFSTFFAYPGSQISWKMTNFFFERYRPEIYRGLHKWCCEQILSCFGSFRAKKIFSKVASFFTVFAYPGSQISWKMTNYFFERYRPEIYRGLHKWCCERILRLLGCFERNNFFWKLAIFWLYLHIRGHRFLEIWPTSFLRDTGLKFFVDCTNGVANEFEGVLGRFERKKNFPRLPVFLLFCISGVTDFLKND